MKYTLYDKVNKIEREFSVLHSRYIAAVSSFVYTTIYNVRKARMERVFDV